MYISWRCIYFLEQKSVESHLSMQTWYYHVNQRMLVDPKIIITDVIFLDDGHQICICSRSNQLISWTVRQPITGPRRPAQVCGPYEPS